MHYNGFFLVGRHSTNSTRQQIRFGGLEFGMTRRLRRRSSTTLNWRELILQLRNVSISRSTAVEEIVRRSPFQIRPIAAICGGITAYIRSLTIPVGRGVDIPSDTRILT